MKHKAIILNAGNGTRMGFYTQDKPKCMTPLAPKETILSHQLKALKALPMEEVIITTGKYHHRIIDYVQGVNEEIPLPYAVRFVYTDLHQSTNYIYSLHTLAQDGCDFQDCIVWLLHGDLIFTPTLLLEMSAKIQETARSYVVCNHLLPLPEKDFKAVLHTYPSETSEDSEHSETLEHSETSETSEHSESSETLEHSEFLEHSEHSKSLGHSESSKLCESWELCESSPKTTDKNTDKNFSDTTIAEIGVSTFHNAIACQPLYGLQSEDWLLWQREIAVFCTRGEVNCYGECALNPLLQKETLKLYPFDTTLFCQEIDTPEDLKTVLCAIETLEEFAQFKEREQLDKEKVLAEKEALKQQAVHKLYEEFIFPR